MLQQFTSRFSRIENFEVNANKCIKLVNDKTANYAEVQFTEVIIPRCSFKQSKGMQATLLKRSLAEFPL